MLGRHVTYFRGPGTLRGLISSIQPGYKSNTKQGPVLQMPFKKIAAYAVPYLKALIGTNREFPGDAVDAYLEAGGT